MPASSERVWQAIQRAEALTATGETSWATRSTTRALDLLFRQARTQNGWLPTPVTDDQLRAHLRHHALGPTSANSCPARFVFLRTPEAKARLLPALTPGQRRQDQGGAGHRHHRLRHALLRAGCPRSSSPTGRRWRTTTPRIAALAEIVAFRNGTLQGAYFMLAARAIGLDVGGMSGFDNAKVDAEFFPDGRIKSNFLCNVGHGDPSKVMVKLPRLDFDEACTLL